MYICIYVYYSISYYYSNVSRQIQAVVPKIITPVTVPYDDDKMVLHKAASELLSSEALVLPVVVPCCCTASIVFETGIDAVPSKNPLRVVVGDALSILVGVDATGVLVLVVIMGAAGAAVTPSCVTGAAVGETVGYCVGTFVGGIVGKFVGGWVHFSQFI